MVNFEDIHALILDLDGVIWKDQQPLGDLPAIFEQIKQLGWNFIFASNNSTYAVEHFLEKLNRFKINLEPWQMVGSAEVTAIYMQKQYPEGGGVFILGEKGLTQTLEKYGFYHQETQVLAVIAGLDRTLSYEKLASATLFIRAGVPFIGTNPDLTYPTPEGQVPGAGAILALLEAASKVHPLILGKPGTPIYHVCLERLGKKPGETLVVGDRLETDIAGGQAIGCPTALVLSGVTTIEQARQWQPQPDWIGQNLEALVLNVARTMRKS
jgi:4-nitrophenyl phosphatase